MVDDVCVQRGFQERFDSGAVQFGPGYSAGQECLPGHDDCTCGVQ